MTDPTRTEPTGFDGNQPQPPDLWARTATETEAKKAVSSTPGWERELLEKLVLGTLAEQRAARRWRNFWRFGWLALITLIIWAAWQRVCRLAHVFDHRGRPPRLHDLRHHSEFRIIPSGG